MSSPSPRGVEQLFPGVPDFLTIFLSKNHQITVAGQRRIFTELPPSFQVHFIYFKLHVNGFRPGLMLTVKNHGLARFFDRHIKSSAQIL